MAQGPRLTAEAPRSPSSELLVLDPTEERGDGAALEVEHRTALGLLAVSDAAAVAEPSQLDAPVVAVVASAALTPRPRGTGKGGHPHTHLSGCSQCSSEPNEQCHA